MRMRLQVLSKAAESGKNAGCSYCPVKLGFGAQKVQCWQPRAREIPSIADGWSKLSSAGALPYPGTDCILAGSKVFLSRLKALQLAHMNLQLLWQSLTAYYLSAAEIVFVGDRSKAGPTASLQAKMSLSLLCCSLLPHCCSCESATLMAEVKRCN